MSLLNFCKDFFFPSQCVGCGCWGLVLCASCQERLLPAHPQILQQHFAFYHYNHFASRILKQGKYRGYKVVIQALMTAIEVSKMEALGSWLKRGQIEALVPIPLTIIDEKRRGYNQTQIITDNMSQKFGLITTKALVKSRPNKSQARQRNWSARRENVRGVYQLIAPEVVRQRRVLLVDDVVTSGSTMTEATRVLCQGNVAAVYWFSLFRAN